MINFEEELKKFKPSLEIDQAEEAIYKNDLRDVTDILEDMMKEVIMQVDDLVEMATRLSDSLSVFTVVS